MQGESEPLDDLEDLFENAPCGYLSIGSDGRILRANRTFVRWIGHEREAVEGKRFQSFLNIAGKIYFETHFAPLSSLRSTAFTRTGKVEPSARTRSSATSLKKPCMRMSGAKCVSK